MSEKIENTFKIDICVVTRLQDNGDGGYTLSMYNNEDDLIADHPNGEVFDPEKRKYVKKELSQKERDDILNEEDPYENGYIDSETLSLEVVDGVPRLTKEGLSFHAGQ